MRRISPGWLGVLWAGVVACGAPDRPAAQDRAAYAQAAEQPARAAVLCMGIQALPLRGECLGLSADALAKQGRLAAAGAVCGLSDTQTHWDAACWLQVAQGSAAKGKEAARLCVQAGPYRRKCMDNAANRDIQRLLPDPPGALGEEAELEHQLRKALSTYLGSREGQRRSRSVMAAWLAERAPAAAWDRAHCGTASDGLCGRAYLHRVARAGSGPPDPQHIATLPAVVDFCQTPRTHPHAASAGLPPWTPALDPIIQATWARVCPP